ncbi:uncharacterized protein KIAA1958 homolog [Ptychodera flava]|uniref:uncharacterized protein KIAA1958 homolog n=1 Tax=Ptychodera flava TaxID=63121 RepID=UPI00396A7D8D
MNAYPHSATMASEFTPPDRRNMVLESQSSSPRTPNSQSQSRLSGVPSSNGSPIVLPVSHGNPDAMTGSHGNRSGMPGSHGNIPGMSPPYSNQNMASSSETVLRSPEQVRKDIASISAATAPMLVKTEAEIINLAEGAIVGDAELIEIDDSSPMESDSPGISENTLKVTRMAVKALRDFYKENFDNSDFENLAEAELNTLLADFFTNMKRKDGTVYSLSSLKAMRAGIQRYMLNVKNINTVHNPSFELANSKFQEKCQHLLEAGLTHVKKAPVITLTDLRKLYTSTSLDERMPVGLQNKVFVDLMLFSHIGSGRNELSAITKDMFKFGQEDNGREYCTIAGGPAGSMEEGNTVTLFAINGCSKCPVKSLKKYLSKLHPVCDNFWQRPVRADMDSDFEHLLLWYQHLALGVRKIGTMMVSLSQEVELSQMYTNKSLQLALADMKKSNVSDSALMADVMKNILPKETVGSGASLPSSVKRMRVEQMPTNFGPHVPISLAGHSINPIAIQPSNALPPVSRDFLPNRIQFPIQRHKLPQPANPPPNRTVQLNLPMPNKQNMPMSPPSHHITMASASQHSSPRIPLPMQSGMPAASAETSYSTVAQCTEAVPSTSPSTNRGVFTWVVNPNDNAIRPMQREMQISKKSTEKHIQTDRIASHDRATQVNLQAVNEPADRHDEVARQSQDCSPKVTTNRCNACGINFDSAMVFAMHRTLHGSDGAFQCSVCRQHFNNTVEFNGHIFSSHH